MFKLPCFSRIAKILGNESAQALVETSVSTSFLVALMLGAADLARTCYAAIEVSNAAKAAVQYGAQNTASAANTSAIQAAASSDAANLTNLTTTVTTTGACSDGTACSGTGGSCVATDCSSSHIETILTVNTSTNFDPLVHIPGFPKTFNLKGSAVQKVLNY